MQRSGSSSNGTIFCSYFKYNAYGVISVCYGIVRCFLARSGNMNEYKGS